MIYACDLANFIIKKCCDDNEPINNIVLNHLLYSIQLRHIGMTDDFLFPDDIEAWQFGAVIPDVYYKHCSNGVMPIMMPSYSTSPYLSNISSSAQMLINRTITTERNYKPWEFKNRLYYDTSVWAEARKASTKTHNAIITIDMMHREAEKRLFRV